MTLVNPFSTWAQVLIPVLLALVFAAVGTWPLCLLVLARYRRAVARGMQPTTDASPGARSASGPPPPTVTPLGPEREIGLVEADSPTSSWLGGKARRATRRAQFVFVAAAVAYGLVAEAVYVHASAQAEWGRASGWRIWVFSWPIVPTLIALSPVNRRQRLLIWLCWLAPALGVPAAFGVPWTGLFLLVALAVGPLIVMLASSARPIYGAAWPIGPTLVIIGLVIWSLGEVVSALLRGAWAAAWPWALIMLGLLGLIPLYAWLVTRTYQAKVVSDETLLLLQWWLVAATAFAITTFPENAGDAALAYSPYAAFLLIFTMMTLVFRPTRDAAVRLLLLRTFGARRRSTRLLRDVTRQWRWVGSVELIIAPDLASETLNPDEFLDFLVFRLSRRFVRDQNTIAGRVAELDLRPDRDGRYRVNELMCHDDTWRPTVEAMISTANVILLDLRGFGTGNFGVVDELERLVSLVPLQKIVALVDTSTDPTALRNALGRAAAVAPQGSPLDRDPAPALRVALNPDTRVGARRLLGALAASAASPQR